MKKTHLFRKIKVAGISGILILLTLEIALRLLGYQTSQSWTYSNEPVMNEPDEKLGWKLVPGSYRYGPYDPSGDSILVTIGKDRTRQTKKQTKIEAQKKMLLIGGSFTMGWALSDHQTLSWKIQKKYPSLNVKNMGVGGYSGYQSLLVLESEMSKVQKPKYVLYGFIEHHRSRNVAESDWLSILQAFSDRQFVKVPYVTYNDKVGLVRHKPTAMKKYWITQKLVLASMMQKAVSRITTYRREEDAKKVSNLIIKEMNKICSQAGSEFHILLLDLNEEEKQEQIKFLKENNIKYIDCAIELTDANIIKGDGHPDESVNTIWARRIINQLDERIN